MLPLIFGEAANLSAYKGVEIDSPYPIPFELLVFAQRTTTDPVHRARFLPLVGEGVCCEEAV